MSDICDMCGREGVLCDAGHSGGVDEVFCEHHLPGRIVLAEHYDGLRDQPGGVDITVLCEECWDAMPGESDMIGPNNPSLEMHDLDGQGERRCFVYAMDAHADYWPAVTDVPCPVDGCDGMVKGAVPGHVPTSRACDDENHRFEARGTASEPTLVLYPEED